MRLCACLIKSTSSMVCLNNEQRPDNSFTINVSSVLVKVGYVYSEVREIWSHERINETVNELEEIKLANIDTERHDSHDFAGASLT